MGEVAINFITQFHQLCGDSVKERQANSYKLFYKYKKNLQDNENDLVFISEHLQPTTHFERILQIDFFIYFRRFAELYEEFMTGNEIVLSKLATQKWFFIKAFGHLSSRELVEIVFPQIGYNVKLKILRRLIVSVHKCDEIFEALRETYGLFLALHVLTKCSNKKILEVLKTETVRLTVRQFKQIYEKNSNLIRVYITKRSKREGSLKWLNESPNIHYLALKNPKMFSDLVQEGAITKKLGRRTSKALITAQKERILENPELWIDILNSNKLVKYLGDHYKVLFFGGDKPICYWKSLLRHYPKKYQFDIYKTIYDEIHQKKFEDDPDTILTEILEIIPEAATREKYAMIKYDKDPKDDYLEYFTPKYSVGHLINQLPHLKNLERRKCFKIATKCCVLNKDTKSLFILCKLVARRLKNDDSIIRQDFFSIICSQRNIFDCITEQHWKLIMEIDAITIAQEESNFYSTEIRIRYIEFLLKHNKSVDQVIAKYPTDWLKQLFRKFPIYKQKGKLLQNILLLEIDFGYTKSIQTNKNSAAIYDCELAATVEMFNKKLLKYAIDVYSNKRICKSVLQMMQAENLDDNTRLSFKGILYMACQKQRNNSEEIDLMHNLFFVNLRKSGSLENCLWFAKHQPSVLEKHFQMVIDNYLKIVRNKPIILEFWKTIRKCSHNKLDEKARTYCEEKIQDENHELKKHMSCALLLVSEPRYFLNFFKYGYMPVSITVDLTDKSAKDLYIVQTECIKHLHFVSAPADIIDFTLLFCQGDYLKHALHPLYSCAYRLPEEYTLNIIVEQLSKFKAVSTRKHSIHISCAVLSKTAAFFYLAQNSETSLLPTMKYLKNNPSDNLWTLLETKILAMENKNADALEYLLDVPLPAAYNVKFFECVWTILSQNENTFLKTKLLEKADKQMKFKSQFVKPLVLDCLLKAEYTNAFIANLLLDFEEIEQFEVIDKVFSVSNTRKLKSFMKILFDMYFMRKKPNSTFTWQFSIIYNKMFNPHEALEECAFANLMCLKDETMEKSAKIIRKLIHNFKKTYGPPACLLLADIIRTRVFPHVYKKSDQIFHLCHHLIINFSLNEENCLWAIKLLPQSVPNTKQTFKLYSDIRNKFIALNDCSIKLSFNLHFMSNLVNDNSDQDMLL